MQNSFGQELKLISVVCAVAECENRREVYAPVDDYVKAEQIAAQDDAGWQLAEFYTNIYPEAKPMLFCPEHAIEVTF